MFGRKKGPKQTPEEKKADKAEKKAKREAEQKRLDAMPKSDIDKVAGGMFGGGMRKVRMARAREETAPLPAM